MLEENGCIVYESSSVKRRRYFTVTVRMIFHLTQRRFKVPTESRGTRFVGDKNGNKTQA